jgi:hypothetical protein
MSYTSLHNHSYFSVLDGYASPREHLEKAKALGLKGFALNASACPMLIVISETGIKLFSTWKINTGAIRFVKLLTSFILRR